MNQLMSLNPSGIDKEEYDEPCHWSLHNIFCSFRTMENVQQDQCAFEYVRKEMLYRLLLK